MFQRNFFSDTYFSCLVCSSLHWLTVGLYFIVSVEDFCLICTGITSWFIWTLRSVWCFCQKCPFQCLHSIQLTRGSPQRSRFTLKSSQTLALTSFDSSGVDSVRLGPHFFKCNWTYLYIWQAVWMQALFPALKHIWNHSSTSRLRLKYRTAYILGPSSWHSHNCDSLIPHAPLFLLPHA